MWPVMIKLTDERLGAPSRSIIYASSFLWSLVSFTFVWPIIRSEECKKISNFCQASCLGVSGDKPRWS